MSLLQGPIPDPAVTSRPVQFIPANAPDNNSVTVNLSNDTASFTNFEKNMKAEKHTVKTTKINGYEAKYTNYTYKGDAEGYTNHMYVLEKNNTFVTIIFRSGYNHDNVTPSVKWDDSKDMNGFMQIVKSVKFL